MTLSQLTIYPLKSARGLNVSQAVVTPRGLEHDRRWLLVDPDGTFLTQRKHARMALMRVALEDGGLLVNAPDMPPLRVPATPLEAEPVTVQIWQDQVRALTVGQKLDAWFSEFLGFPCRLVMMPEDAERQIDPDYANPGEQVSFADGFPYLLIGEGSLEELNGRLDHPLPMNRFRPNLVIRGAPPFAEDGWARIRIGEVTFRVVKPCGRCVVTTTDQDTAEVGEEPLKTLATYRRQGSKVMFGQNLIQDSLGTLRVGDALEVLA